MVETLYSMDGDRAPLDTLAGIAAQHGAMLIVDEAHATAVHGPGGRGLAAHLEGHEDVIALHTCGKGLGVEGALVTASRTIVDLLVNRGRGFVFSTRALAIDGRGRLGGAGTDARCRRGARPSRRADRICCAAVVRAIGPRSTEKPDFTDPYRDDARTMQIAETLQAQGFDVRGIRPPTVPRGTARLRISLTLNVDEPVIAALGEALHRALSAQPA